MRVLALVLLVFVLSVASAQALTFKFEKGDPHYVSMKDKYALVYDLGTKYKCVRDTSVKSDGMVFLYMHFPEVKTSDVKISFKFSQYKDAFIEVYTSDSAPSALYDVPKVKSLVYSSAPLGDVTDYTATFTVEKGSGEYLYFIIDLPGYSTGAEFYLYKDGSYEVSAPSPTAYVSLENVAGYAVAAAAVVAAAYLVSRRFA